MRDMTRNCTKVGADKLAEKYPKRQKIQGVAWKNDLS